MGPNQTKTNIPETPRMKSKDLWLTGRWDTWNSFLNRDSTTSPKIEQKFRVFLLSVHCLLGLSNSARTSHKSKFRIVSHQNQQPTSHHIIECCYSWIFSAEVAKLDIVVAIRWQWMPRRRQRAPSRNWAVGQQSGIPKARFHIWQKKICQFLVGSKFFEKKSGHLVWNPHRFHMYCILLL